MEEENTGTVVEDKPTGNGISLKRRRESDDEEDDEGGDTTEKEKPMHVVQPPMDEATSKLHEKYEIVDERLSHAREQQKKLYLIVFQRFIMTLSDFLNECENKNVDPVSTPWLKWIIERLQDIFF